MTARHLKKSSASVVLYLWALPFHSGWVGPKTAGAVGLDIDRARGLNHPSQQLWQRLFASLVRAECAASSQSGGRSPRPDQAAEQVVIAAEADGLRRVPPRAWRRAGKGACKGGDDRRGGGARTCS